MTSDPSLRRHADFRRLWAAQAVSEFGARITREGLPMMAVAGLAATPFQVGVLAAFRGGPSLVVGLSAGGFVDAHRRRPVLIACDLIRAAVLVALPVCAWLHLLAMWQVYVAAALVASASVVFDIADHAYLPSLIGREALTDGNARLSATESVAEVVGPALAGQLFQWLTAPFAVAVNAATYLVSALVLARIGHHEPAPEKPRQRTPWAERVSAGFRAAWAEPMVRPLFLMTLVNGLFGGIFSALYILFSLRVLHLTPGTLGLAIACGGAGGLLGTWLTKPMTERLGVGGAIVTAAVLGAASALLIPLAPAAPGWGLAVLIVSQIGGDAFGVVVIVLATSLRQSVLPGKMLGRVAASFTALSGGLSVVGALAGGLLGQVLGAREALWIAAVGYSLGPLLLAASPLRRLREIPLESPAPG
jgi:MFS family permease